MLSKNIIHQIEHRLGTTITGVSYVNGGDIALAYKIETPGQHYFLKVRRHHQPGNMLVAEAEGLHMLRVNYPGKVPGVIACGDEWLLLEWLNQIVHTDASMKQFGKALAELHLQQHVSTGFGFASDNFIGTLPQQNHWHSRWDVFMHKQRIMPLVHMLAANNYITANDVDAAEALGEKLAGIIPEENPSLLHGDLWSGNYMITEGEHSAIFDPAVYYGHREMDLALTYLFGGFSNSFYEAYQHYAPLQAGFQHRLPLMQLYPLLVHAVLFGGSYISRCREIIKKYC